MWVDTKIDVKIKLAVLWACIMSLYIYADFFTLMAPNVIDNMRVQQGDSGPLSPVILVIYAVLLIIPALMMPASVLLKAKTSRLLNLIFGIFYALFSVIIIITEGSKEWYLFYVLYQIVELFIFFILIRTAWKWPKK